MKRCVWSPVVVVLFCLAFFKVQAQDIHFSQYNQQPLFLNPAFAGVNGGDYRLAATYRSQWAGLGKFNTVAASADMAVLKRTRKSNYGGIGLSFFNDRAGDLSFSTTQVNLHLTYTVLLNNKGTQTLTTGLIGGFGQRSIDFSKVTTDSQFGDQGFDPNNPTGENFVNNRKLYADVGAGMLWSLTANKNTNFYAGLAVTHVNQPNLSFLDDRTEKLYMKATIHGGAYFKVTRMVHLLPSFMYLNQGPHNQLNFGSLVKFRTSSIPTNNTAFYVGGYYRLKDALILAARFDIAGFNIGFSYDLNVSKLTKATKLNGGPEISLIYAGQLKNKKNRTDYCPVL